MQSLCLLLLFILSFLCFVSGRASDSLFLTHQSREDTSAQPAWPFGSPGTCFEDMDVPFQNPWWQWSDREQLPHLHLLGCMKQLQVMTLLLFHEAASKFWKTTHFLSLLFPFFRPCQYVIGELDWEKYLPKVIDTKPDVTCVLHSSSAGDDSETGGHV